MSDRRPKLVLIDGHALAYRAYFALVQTQLATSTGELTGGIFGFVQMLLNVLRDVQPDYIAVTWDAGLSGRKEQLPQYKAQRASMPDDLRRQIERIRQVLDAFRIRSLQLEGYEADDLLGTLALKASEDNIDTLIVTGDSDTFQLVGPHVSIMTSQGRTNETVIHDEGSLFARFGLAPAQLIDHKALKGDTSDNVPGVPGVGDKTATGWLQQHHTVEGVLAHLADLKPPKARDALAQMKDQVLLNKRLVTISSSVPIEVDWDELHLQPYDTERVTALFRELEFRRLMDRLPAQPGDRGQRTMDDRQTTIDDGQTIDDGRQMADGEPQTPDGQLGLFPAQPSIVQRPASPVGPSLGHYSLVDTPDKLNDLVYRLSSSVQRPSQGEASHSSIVQGLTLDTETTHTDPMRAVLVGISITAREGEGYYIPLAHRDGANLSYEQAQAALNPLLADPTILKIAHNANYDLTVLWLHGFDVQGDIFDTMIAAWLIDPGRGQPGLKDLAWTKLGVEMTNIEQLIGKGREQITMDLVDPAKVAEYASADVDMTLRLASLLELDLKERGLWDLFRDVEMPLVPILTRMEMAGIGLDVDCLLELSTEFHQRMTALETDIYELAGYPFNIASTKQLASILFDQLGLPPQKRTTTGYSTDITVLEALRGQHPIIGKLIEHRQLAKLKSTYIDALPQLVHPGTGRIHTDFNQCGSATGRISSSNPNLQNIPIRTDEGKRIRRAFIAKPGHVLLTADYSQIELRVLASMCQEPTLVEAFQRDEDIHARTAALLFNIPIEQVTPAQRRLAKTTNFGIIYGISGFGLAARTDLTTDEAMTFIKNYFAKLPGVEKLMDEIKKGARRDGYVSTLLGRRRYFPALKSGARINVAERQRMEREAINAPVQGTAADIVKLAMIRVAGDLQAAGLHSQMLLQVHDELVLETPLAEIDATAQVVCDAMEHAFTLNGVRLKVDIATGERWSEVADMRPVEVNESVSHEL